MEWLIKRGDKKFCIDLPSQIPDNQIFSLTIEGKPQQARFDKNSEAVYIKTPEGEVCFKARTSQIDRYDGDSESKVMLDFYNPLKCQTESFHGTVEPWVPGMENRAAAAAAKGKVMRAPMTGKILEVLAKDGDQVESGSILLVIEAMKMENKVFAQASGKVEQLKVSPGQAITIGDEILTIKG